MATTEASSEATTQGYQLEGSLLEVCNCDTLCPCWIGDDPDNGYCQSVVAYNLDEGDHHRHRRERADAHRRRPHPREHPRGQLEAGGPVDDRATDEQMDALLQCFGGQLGGPLADLAQLIGERVVDRAREDRARDRGRRRHAEGRGQDRLHDAALPRARRQHHDAQQLDLLDGAGLAGVRREGRPPEGRRATGSASGSWRARTPSSPTGRSTTAASDEPAPADPGRDQRPPGPPPSAPRWPASPRSRTTTRCSRATARRSWLARR